MSQQTVVHEHRHSQHSVQFYEGDSFIYEAVAEFFAAGLQAGQPLVLISSEQHRDGIYGCLSTLGFVVDDAEKLGHLKWLDARETLSKFMVEGMPDGDLFRSCVGGIIEQARAGREHLSIRAFGEMVDLLLKDGRPEAALRLEQLWNEVGRNYGFALLCAYSIANLYREEHWRYFRKICDQHLELPPEQIAAIGTARQAGMASQHIPAESIRDFALRRTLLTSAELSHFADCDSCSELWWSLKQSTSTGRKRA
jgi:hypothetical protein